MTNAFITLIFVIAAIFALLPLGLFGVGIAWSLGSVCIFVLTAVRGGHLLGLALKDMLLSIFPALFSSLLMCAVIYAIDLPLSNVSGPVALYKPRYPSVDLSMPWSSGVSSEAEVRN